MAVMQSDLEVLYLDQRGLKELPNDLQHLKRLKKMSSLRSL